LNYLVKIDTDGKLRWDRNGQYVDTSPGKWRDAGEGKGIVPVDEDEGSITAPPPTATRSDSASSSSSEEEALAAQHYQGVKKQTNLNFFQRIWKDRFTTKGLMERLLRKTVQKNTWLYVSVRVALGCPEHSHLLTVPIQDKHCEKYSYLTMLTYHDPR
ncbi:hypothetical protein CPB86DRAFT_712372, partial [Serendipita vermifera]